MKVFDAHRSRALVCSTVMSITVLVFVDVLVLAFHGLSSPWTLTVWLVTVLVVAVRYVVATQDYAVSGGELRIRQLAWCRQYSLAGASIYLDASIMYGLKRVPGHGAFFAVDGLYYSPRHRWVRLHIRNATSPFLVVLANGRKLIISPDKREEMMAAMVGEGACIRAAFARPLRAALVHGRWRLPCRAASRRLRPVWYRD
ncbi:hypothetical protein FHW69_002331 [Luteibacter sp. Sphag1AF]|uniref:hypothetical protein n=1 Tax=Luteibacter sp. Sphag1AF TaxID=2587031 RepID=UPI00161AE83C|nr:hypothetical protein [Luteibacter sp. Sphag1AF]MBB3227708.1 hypothetical protein [Luteibacter sp. Sphag1AF]